MQPKKGGCKKTRNWLFNEYGGKTPKTRAAKNCCKGTAIHMSEKGWNGFESKSAYLCWLICFWTICIALIILHEFGYPINSGKKFIVNWLFLYIAPIIQNLHRFFYVSTFVLYTHNIHNYFEAQKLRYHPV